MIIWVNGAFGSGKTQTAAELHRRITNSYIYDPENIGLFIRKNIPASIKRKDFQDYPLWRETNYKMLEFIASEFDGVIIAPMTIVNPDYYDEIIGKLRADGIDVKHYILYASKNEILRRLKTRGEGQKSWAAAQIDRCLNSFNDVIVEGKINTEKMSIAAIAEEIAGRCDITLEPDNRSMLTRILHRTLVKIKHIRL